MKTRLTTAVALTACTFLGCADTPEPVTHPNSTTAEGHHEDGGHAHPSQGPHGGDLIELGNEEYHAELVHPGDHDEHGHAEAGEHKQADAEHAHADHEHAGITVYILDGTAMQVVAIDATDLTINFTHDGKPQQSKLAAMPDKTDPAGKSSRFVSTDKELLELFHKENAKATLSVKINGKPYRGNITHAHHDEHGHDHGKAHDHGGGHSHGEADALIWRGEPREYAGMRIRLGHHGKHLHAGEAVEPAVSITRKGRPADDIKVFNSLTNAEGTVVLAKEVATVFEPTTKDEPAHYAQGPLSIPQGVSKVVIRYRIVAPQTEAITYDVAVAVE